MKTRKMYESKEQAERLTPYVVVNFSEYEPAHIMENCSNKKVAENAKDKIGGGVIMTRKQSKNAIKEWNDKHFPNL